MPLLTWKRENRWNCREVTSMRMKAVCVAMFIFVLLADAADGINRSLIYKTNRNFTDLFEKRREMLSTGDESRNFRSVSSRRNMNPNVGWLNNHRKTLFSREFRSNRTNSRVNNSVHKNDEFTSSWAIKLPDHFTQNPFTSSEHLVIRIAEDLGLVNHGSIGHIPGHFLLVHHSFYKQASRASRDLRALRRAITKELNSHPHVEWVRNEVVRKRYKRSLQFKDQFFPSQWHLDNLKFIGHDINVTGVWEKNITGKGVTVSVIDDGVEWTNPDILDNYSASGSWDLNSNDGDPMPRVDEAGLNHHGTRCAGEIAAVANEYCGVGVAFGAKVSGIRILDGPMTDSLEAMAFNTKSDVNDVYSCSWGPDDNGRTVDGPHQLAQAALAQGVMNGRQGYGSIFVVASGNGGHFKDNCNFDGYANSIFTVTIGAVDELGQMPYYAEQCAAMLAVTYSSGQGHQRNIVTTDWRLGTGTGCTDRHTGTSAAAPLAAGVIALMLQTRKCLTWRDIQHLIVYTSVRVDIDPDEWQVNGAGFAHSHKHAFGLLDSWRLVTTSKIWPSVPYMTSWSSNVMVVHSRIPSKVSYNLTKHLTVTANMAAEVVTLEHVTVTVNIKHVVRGNLAIFLISPYGTISRLASYRKYDKSREGFKDWTFSTVRCWGEKPSGRWSLQVVDRGLNREEGVLKSWRLTFYGSSIDVQDIQERKKLVTKAVSGRYLHHSGPPCPLPPSPGGVKKAVISSRVLKVVFLLGGLLFLVSVYLVLETVCGCEEQQAEEKKFSELESTMEILTPDGFDLDAFVPGTLAKDDEERLSHIIEHGMSRPLTPTITDSLETLNNETTAGTPDEVARVTDFEQRLKFALEQSLLLQMKQLHQIDNLQHDIQVILGEENLQTVDIFSEVTERRVRSSKKKLKGILKKPKQYKE